MKILIQTLWEAGIIWDEKVPQAIQEAWSDWRTELPNLAAKPINRYYFHCRSALNHIELHGFADTSIKAYAAVTYVRATYGYDDGPPMVTLITAKSKVAPLKILMVPRLELCGAHLLAKLLMTVKVTLGVPDSDIHCWTDSTIVLNWLDGSTKRYKTYVANCITSILKLAPSRVWRHVPTNDNPADCASRSILPREFLDHALWWTGPQWLYNDLIDVPAQPTNTVEMTEAKLVVATIVEPTPWLVTRISSLQRLPTIVEPHRPNA